MSSVGSRESRSLSTDAQDDGRADGPVCERCPSATLAALRFVRGSRCPPGGVGHPETTLVGRATGAVPPTCATADTTDDPTAQSDTEDCVAKPLVIVESKAKAKTIEGFLGRDRFVVMASVGHVRDLPNGAKQAPKGVTDPRVRRLGIDVDDHFTPIYVVPDSRSTSSPISRRR